MGRYARLALAEREEIVLLRRGGSCGGMAGAAGGDKAAVSREMAGNSFAVGSGRGLCGVLSCGSIGRPGGSRAGSRSNGRD